MNDDLFYIRWTWWNIYKLAQKLQYPGSEWLTESKSELPDTLNATVIISLYTILC